MLRKNEEYIVDIIDNGFEGEGIAKIGDFTVFVPNTIRGEKVKIVIVKVLSNYAFGKALEILIKSISRVEPDCDIYIKCGGCDLRHLEYEETLNLKKNIVENCIKKELKQKIKVENTIGMGIPYFYRNKLQYPFGINNQGNSIMGIYSNRSHKIISGELCYIQNELTQKIAKDILEFVSQNNVSVYNEKTLKGLLRHVIIKIGIATNEVMVILVLNNKKFSEEKELVKYLINKYTEIKTIVKNINNKNTNVICGDKNINLYGEGYIYDILGEYKFKISPLSFYQTNLTQTEMLYNIAIEFADLNRSETVFDLYCGIGTIGIFASKYCKDVYGIEVVSDAIKNAKENSKINNVENIEFINGKVELELPKLIENKHLNPNCVFIDPPRKGCDEKTLDTLLKIEANKIVYISCNPATLARDLKVLFEKYEIKKVQPVDMFPFTHHVETVVLLTKK